MSTGKYFLSNADANTPAAANLYVNQFVSGLSLAHLCPLFLTVRKNYQEITYEEITKVECG